LRFDIQNEAETQGIPFHLAGGGYKLPPLHFHIVERAILGRKAEKTFKNCGKIPRSLGKASPMLRGTAGSQGAENNR